MIAIPIEIGEERRGIGFNGPLINNYYLNGDDNVRDSNKGFEREIRYVWACGDEAF